MDETMEETIEYEQWEKEPGEDRFERYLDLLYRYLDDFISGDVLKRDLRYCFKKGRIVGASHGDRLVGAVAGVYTPFFEKFHIAHIAVEEEYQGRGIGSELTERVIPKDMDAAVHLNRGNPDIERFYEKLGFEPTHTRFKRTGEDGKPSD